MAIQNFKEILKFGFTNPNFLISNVIETLKGRSTATTNALEGLKVVEIIERIYTVRNEQFDLSKVN
jgi:hypothetical protein